MLIIRYQKILLLLYYYYTITQEEAKDNFKSQRSAPRKTPEKPASKLGPSSDSSSAANVHWRWVQSIQQEFKISKEWWGATTSVPCKAIMRGFLVGLTRTGAQASSMFLLLRKQNMVAISETVSYY